MFVLSLNAVHAIPTIALRIAQVTRCTFVNAPFVCLYQNVNSPRTNVKILFKSLLDSSAGQLITEDVLQRFFFACYMGQPGVSSNQLISFSKDGIISSMEFVAFTISPSLFSENGKLYDRRVECKCISNAFVVNYSIVKRFVFQERQ